jgi:hypothetical protein
MTFSEELALEEGMDLSLDRLREDGADDKTASFLCGFFSPGFPSRSLHVFLFVSQSYHVTCPSYVAS